MAEKRFTSEIIDTEFFHIEKITDNLNAKTYSETDDVVDLMNKLWWQTQRFEKHNQELSEENEQLKKENEWLKSIHFANDVLKENEQLKSAIKYCMRISESNGALSPMRLKSIFYYFEL